MGPVDLGLILSYQCQSKCAHCLYNCGPSWKEWMDLEDVKSALVATKHWDHQYRVHITGGEPFLNFPLLIESVKIASELDIPVYVETNAGWAYRDKDVNEKLKLLIDAGLRSIMISVSPFHAESIPPERTLRLIKIATRLFGIKNLYIYQQKWLDMIVQFGIEHNNSLNNYIDAYGSKEAGRLFWQGYGLIAGGRAGYQLGYLTEMKSVDAFVNEKCTYEILFADHSHFDLYGNYIPAFCGGISLGNWKNIAEIENNLKNGIFNQIVGILLNRGVYGLYEYAFDKFGYKPRDDGYAGKCHLCVDIRRFLVKNGEFPELSPLQFYEDK